MDILDVLRIYAKNMKSQLTALFYSYQDKRLGYLPKIVIGITILYALSPIDLIPDFIPVLGYLDDLLIVPALIALSIKLIPENIMVEAQSKAVNEPIKLRKNWTFGIIFIFLWLIVVYLIIKAII